MTNDIAELTSQIATLAARREALRSERRAIQICEARAAFPDYVVGTRMVEDNEPPYEWEDVTLTPPNMSADEAEAQRLPWASASTEEDAWVALWISTH